MPDTKLENKNKIGKIIELITENFPILNEKKQSISIQIYKQLAKGQPVSIDTITTLVNLPKEEVKSILDSWPGVYYDDNQEIHGYWGLAIPKMNHSFKVDGQQLYTWCAWDALFIPQIINKTADVESTCPVTNTKINLTVSPKGIVEHSPEDIVISMINPDAGKITEDVIKNFCHFIYFFSSEKAGKEWVSKNEGTFLLTLEETQELSKQKNALQYSIQ